MEKLTEQQEFNLCMRAGCEVESDGPVSESGFIKLKTKYPCAIIEEDNGYKVIERKN